MHTHKNLEICNKTFYINILICILRIVSTVLSLLLGKI